MIIKQDISFTKEECESIISRNDTNITNWRLGDRKYNSQPINYSLETKWLFDKLKKFFEENTNIKIIKIKETIHFHKFTKEEWFGKHNDNRDNRIYAVGILLNDNFDGGDFILYNDEKIVIEKITGNTYIFNVGIDHEVTTIKKGERYSLIWFLEKDNIELKNNII